MFNIAKSGYIVNITSEGIDFGVTGTFVSGTSFKVANIWAEGCPWEITVSGTIANIKLISFDGVELRNNNLMNASIGADSSEMGNPPRDGSLILGNDTLMHTNTSDISTDWMGRPWSVVRNGNYVYMRIVSAALFATGTIRIREYNISTGLYTDLDVVALGADADIVSVHLSIIKDRKLLVYAENGIVYNPYDIYIIDFEDSSSVVTTTQEQPLSLKVKKRSNGKIWLYIFGIDAAGGHEVKYKNYTDDTAWASTAFADDTGYSSSDPIFVNDDYLVWFLDYYSSPTPCKVRGLAFNLDTYAITNSDLIECPTNHDNWYVYTCAPDNETGKAFAVANGWRSLGGTPPLYNVWESWVEYIPSTSAISLIYSIDANVTIANLHNSITFSSRENAYILDYPNPNILYKATTLEALGTMPAGIGWYNTCHQIDDSGPSIWWCSNGGVTLYRTRLDGTLINTYPIWGGPAYSSYRTAILHAKSAIIFVVSSEEYPNYNWDYILIK